MISYYQPKEPTTNPEDNPNAMLIHATDYYRLSHRTQRGATAIPGPAGPVPSPSRRTPTLQAAALLAVAFIAGLSTGQHIYTTPPPCLYQEQQAVQYDPPTADKGALYVLDCRPTTIPLIPQEQPNVLSH